jgi:protein-S-isoprenylcysteine O-methyltransferase Ste14
VRTGYIVLVNGLLSLAVILAAWMVFRLDQFWPFRLPAKFGPLAWPLLVGGTSLIVWAVATFARQAGATGAVGNPPDRLVPTGPFRFVRNPIYLGAFFLLVAVSFHARSPSFLVLALVFAPSIDQYVRHAEEPRLARRFGDAYRQYGMRVLGWLPRVPAP